VKQTGQPRWREVRPLAGEVSSNTAGSPVTSSWSSGRMNCVLKAPPDQVWQSRQ